MIPIIILICSVYVPPEHCNEDTAVDVIKREVPLGIAGFAGQVEMVNNQQAPDWHHYLKVIARRR